MLYLKHMKWKELSNSEDVVCYEGSNQEISIRIEARLKEDKSWEIYKIYRNKSRCLHIDEYNADSKLIAEEIIERLKYEPLLSKKVLMRDGKEILRRKLELKIKRVYKEPFVEKWNLMINNIKDSGFVIARYGDSIEMDILLQSKFESIEKEILCELNKSLGIKGSYEELIQNVYYFNKNQSYKSGFKGG
ncbi:MAG: hypothetical protein AABY14_02820, partial [Nanoarchaeota archaeon]